MTWFDRLCDRINPPMPDAMQARMLRGVWAHRERQTLPKDDVKVTCAKAPRDGYWSITSWSIKR